MIHIGLIGGGQLARMMIYRTTKMGFRFSTLDPDPQAPASILADQFLQGGLKDPQALGELCRSVDVATYDIEHVGIEALKTLENEGLTILPSPRVLEIIQDKWVQKTTLTQAGLPQPGFRALPPGGLSQLKDQDFPVVQKTRTGGYDGRGVQILRSRKDVEKALGGETYLEDLVDYVRELAVLVCRGRDGSVVTYPVVEMGFDPQLNICDHVIMPARIAPAVAAEAEKVAIAAVEALGGVGIFGVELFETKDGRILINELAPRPHNSGHVTMETCDVCQFENHIRAVAGLPIIQPRLLTPGVMINILGSGKPGATTVTGFEKALRVPGFSLHLYGKTQSRPGRKMGHFTLTAPDVDQALARASEVKLYLKVEGL